MNWKNTVFLINTNAFFSVFFGYKPNTVSGRCVGRWN